MKQKPYWVEVFAYAHSEATPNAVFVRDGFGEVRVVPEPPVGVQLGDKINLARFANVPTNQLGSIIGSG